jgi:hypothetical protein
VKCAAFELPFTARQHASAVGDATTCRPCWAFWPTGLVHSRRADGRIRTHVSARSTVDVDERVVSSRCGQPPISVVGQLRRRRHDQRRA